MTAILIHQINQKSYRNQYLNTDKVCYKKHNLEHQNKITDVGIKINSGTAVRGAEC